MQDIQHFCKSLSTYNVELLEKLDIHTKNIFKNLSKIYIGTDIGDRKLIEKIYNYFFVNELYFCVYDGVPTLAGFLTENTRLELRKNGVELLTKIGNIECKIEPQVLVYLVYRTENDENERAGGFDGFHTGWSMDSFVYTYPNLINKSSFMEKYKILEEFGLLSKRTTEKFITRFINK